MPDTDKARSLLAQQALGYRNQAEQFRTVREGTRSAVARAALARLADIADRMAAEIEAQIRAMNPGY